MSITDEMLKEQVVNRIRRNLSEVKTQKPGYGSKDGFSYAVHINDIDNEFFKMPFGRQIEYAKKIKDFTSKAKKVNVGAKGKPTLSAVKDWIKTNKPTQFYAKWKSDNSNYKDDSVELFYMNSEMEENLDKFDKETAMKNFDDLEDQDINNDGEVDDQDKYLHNRRKKVTKIIQAK
jgi:hypothetical protein